jgi:hypothetical protein
MKILILFFVINLTACVTDYAEYSESRRINKIEALAEEARQRDNNPNQYNYNLGMEHGCNSGGNASGNYAKQHMKNIDLYVKDAYYKSGWDDGFNQCKAQGQLINDVITNSY